MTEHFRQWSAELIVVPAVALMIALRVRQGRTRHRIGVTLLSLALSFVAGMTAFAQDQSGDRPKRTVITRPVHAVHGAPQPSSWEMMVETAELVAHARILTRRYVTGPANVPFTRYDAHVIDLITGDARALVQPGQLVLFHLGGIVELPDGRERRLIRDQPEWWRQQELMLFLKWNPTLGGWVQAFGTSATFEVRGQTGNRRIRSLQSRSTFVRSQDDKPLDDVKSILRVAAGRRR